MSTILDEIIEYKKKWVFNKKRLFPLDIFKKDITKSDRSFRDALDSDRAVYIFECKKASPSKGVIRKKFDLNEISSVYNKYADAISVLTDERYFDGNFANINIVRNKVTQPILCKDFIVDEYQLYLARYYSADAVLLMLSVLDDSEYRKLEKIAKKLSLDILTEVSNEEETQRAVELNAKIIGINNRNLKNMKVDISNTAKLAKKIPKNTIIISESGISKNWQLRTIRKYANGFLIGSSLMKEKNLELAIKKLVYGFYKICGITSIDDAQKVKNSGALYGGLIFAKNSPRFIDFDMAKNITSNIMLNWVGVFADEDIDNIAEYSNKLKLYAIQLHGNENQEYINNLKAKIHRNTQIWKAYPVKESIPNFYENIDYHILDTKNESGFGGTGESFDWGLLPKNKNIILAGGINSQNIKQAIAQNCATIDINSGVESAPGKKDEDKIKEIFNIIADF